jgi:hypothetical protein
MYFRRATFLQRKSTILNCHIKPLSRGINPPFTKKDLQQKMKICGVANLQTCLVTLQEKGVKVGDHVYETKGYFRKTGRYGIDDEWNTLPVCGAKNISYKVFRHVNKNIGYQTLSKRELQKCTKEQIRIYKIITKWKRYVKKRGAKMSFKLTAKQQTLLEEVHTLHLKHAKQHESLFKKIIRA